MKITGFILSILLLASPAYAIDCSNQATLITALSEAGAGDTVTCDAGNLTWSSNMTVPDGVTLAGAGKDATIVASSTFINVYVGNGSRFTGFELSNGVAKPSGGKQNWVIDHSDFTATTYNSNGITISGVNYNQAPTGVYHGCSFTRLRFVIYGSQTGHDWYTNYPAIDPGVGDTDNTTNSYAHVVYFEGCTFTSTGNYNNGVDSNYGGAKVIRFCTINDLPMGSHGQQSYTSSRGTVHHSMYRNTWTQSAIPQSSYAWWFRGGTGMFFDNKCISSSTQYCDFVVDFEHAYDTRFPLCSANTYGENTAPHPDGTSTSPDYLCRDGVGVGKDAGFNALGTFTYGQASAPLYIWHNTYSTSAGGTFVAGPFNLANNAEDYAKEGRDYFLDASSVAGFTGGGVTTGLYVNAPTCNAAAKGHGYWATDRGGDWNTTEEWDGADGALYVCDGAGTWDLYFTPLVYPHPLVGATGEPDTEPPVEIVATVSSNAATALGYGFPMTVTALFPIAIDADNVNNGVTITLSNGQSCSTNPITNSLTASCTVILNTNATNLSVSSIVPYGGGNIGATGTTDYDADDSVEITTNLPTGINVTIGTMTGLGSLSAISGLGTGGAISGMSAPWIAEAPAEVSYMLLPSSTDKVLLPSSTDKVLLP